jgi:hypothetical protein
MKSTGCRRFVLSGCLSLVWALAAWAAEPTSSLLNPEKFAQLHALIKPQPQEEQWAKIPWLVSLWEARQRAAAEGKPILLWEMDGHPLGCT